MADLAADFESPRIRAVVVADGTGGVGMPYVIRAPTVLADSRAWSAAVGSLDMEPAHAASVARPEVLPHPALSQPSVPEPIPAPAPAPAASPAALVADQKTGTIMPAGPVTVRPSGSEEWLASIAAERGLRLIR